MQLSLGRYVARLELPTQRRPALSARIFVARDSRTLLKASDMITAAGEQLEFVWLGPRPEDAPTLVFLHEGLGCVSLWRDFPARLAADCGCGALVYSRKG